MPTVVNSYRLSSTFGASPRSVTINSVTSGNTVLVVVSVADSNQGAGVSVTDNHGNTYTQDLSFVPPSLDSDVFFFRASNVTNAPTSVSCSFGSGSALLTFNILEVSGLDNASPVDATAFDASSTNNASPSKSITTTTDGSLLIASLRLSTSRTFTADAAYSQLPNTATSDFDFFVWDNDVGAAGSKSVSGTLSSGTNHRWGVIAYKAAAGGPSRPSSDITTTGWSASSGAVLFDMIDEASAADGDYIISPELGGSPGPAVFGLTPTLPIGTHQIEIRARRTAGVGQVRVILQDSGGTTVGTSAWQSLTASFATYAPSVTTTGTAARASIEVQA